MPQGPNTTYKVGGANQQSRNGQRASAGVRVSLGWPTERWVGLIVLSALGLLILIRLGFRGIGFQGNIGGRINV